MDVNQIIYSKYDPQLQFVLPLVSGGKVVLIYIGCTTYLHGQ